MINNCRHYFQIYMLRIRKLNSRKLVGIFCRVQENFNNHKFRNDKKTRKHSKFRRLGDGSVQECLWLLAEPDPVDFVWP